MSSGCWQILLIWKRLLAHILVIPAEIKRENEALAKRATASPHSMQTKCKSSAFLQEALYEKQWDGEGNGGAGEIIFSGGQRASAVWLGYDNRSLLSPECCVSQWQEMKDIER